MSVSLEAGDSTPLYIKAEQDHVTVGYHIFLAFLAHLASITRALFAAAGHVIGIRDGLGADKALFKIRMDHARRRWRQRALAHGPSAGFLGGGGEEGDEVQQRVAGVDDAGETGFLQPQGGESVSRS